MIKQVSFIFALATINLLIVFASAAAKGKVFCDEDLMRVDIGIPVRINANNENNKQEIATMAPQIYLEGLKGYPKKSCQPKINGSLAEFRLSLTDFHECGVTRMLNKLTGKKIYYHKIIIEDGNSKEILSVKCTKTSPVYNLMMNEMNQNVQQQQPYHVIIRRDVLPAGFREQEDLEITTSLIERAPEPILGVGVRQGTQLITGELNVSPGTPLTMEIFLDKSSASVYGLGVTYMQVTDTKAQEETIIFNGCSVDPYLFDNFNTRDGDFLSAKFRAFKFPESTYVQFRATVNVCLDKCSGTPCSNGQIGYGRRKRDIGKTLADPNKIYEISLATFIKVSDIEGVNPNEVLRLEEKLKELKLNNQRLARNSRGSFLEPTKTELTPAYVVDEKELNGKIVASSASALTSNIMSYVLIITLALYKGK